MAGCRAALEIVGAWAGTRGAACVFTTGNHDRRPASDVVFGSGHLDATGADVGTRGPEGTCAAVSSVNGLRLAPPDHPLAAVVLQRPSGWPRCSPTPTCEPC